MEKGLNLLEYTKDLFSIEGFEANLYSPLELAFIGDAVYEVVIRTIIVGKYNTQVNKLHKMSSNYVKAATQSKIALSILEELTPEELSVYKRGRNAKSGTMAKNATMADYRMATGFEALIGYLYLKGLTIRMMELIKLGLDRINQN